MGSSAQLRRFNCKLVETSTGCVEVVFEARYKADRNSVYAETVYTDMNETMSGEFSPSIIEMKRGMSLYN